jgi:hypothetical protein
LLRGGGGVSDGKPKDRSLVTSNSQNNKQFMTSTMALATMALTWITNHFLNSGFISGEIDIANAHEVLTKVIGNTI